MGSWQEHLVPYRHVTYWHTIYYSCETKTDKWQEGRKLFTYPKNKRAETRHRQLSGVHPWSIRTDLGRHGAKGNSGDAESDRRRPSQKSNIPQRESRIRLRSCRGVRSTLVSQGILRQSDELSGEPPAISFKNYFCGARSLMLWFALRFFNFIGYTQRRSRTLLESICCDLLSDFLTLRIYTTLLIRWQGLGMLWFAFRFFNFTDIHNQE